MNASEIFSDSAKTTREADWRDALAFRAVQIGKWAPDDEHFWPRLANLAFHGVLLDRLPINDGDTKPLWHDVLAASERFAVEHLAERLLACGFVLNDEDGDPDLDIEATKAVWIAAYRDLPELCGAPATDIGNLRGRWFSAIAAATAETLAAQGAVTAQACRNRYGKLDRENRFLCSRPCAWIWPEGPREELRSSGVEFIHYIYGVGSASAAAYTHIFQNEPSLHDGARIRWDIGTWLRAGWEFGQCLREDNTRDLVRQMVSEGPEQDLAYTHGLLARLVAAAPECVRWPDLGKACVAYIKERHGLVRDGHGPEVCLHALDYGFFMALGLRGLLSASPANTPVPAAAPDASSPRKLPLQFPSETNPAHN